MNTSKMSTGSFSKAILAGLLWTVSLSFASAAQSPSYSIDTDSPTYGQNTAEASPSYQMNGGITWRQTALASPSFQIVPDPVMQTSSAASAGSSQTQTSESPTTPIGGHRGSSSLSSEVLHPAASSQSSVASVRHSRASSIASVASSFSSSSTLSASGVTFSSSALSAFSQSSQQAGSIASCPAAAAQNVCHLLLSTIVMGGGFSLNDLLAALLFGFALGLLVGVCLTLLVRFALQPAARRRKKVSRNGRMLVRAVLIVALVIAAASFALIYQAHAATTTPQRYVYNGHLLDSAGHPITTAHSIRFSFWKSADLVNGDITGAGALNTAATTYGGWQEVDTVTPDASGYFSVQLGSGTTLPSLASFTPAELQQLFLQVDVKASGDPDTSYETLDVDGTNPSVDRSPILSVPFAHNADMIDQREIGTGSGSIPLFGPNGSFTLDAGDTSSGTVSLQFGSALAKSLTYDKVNHLFSFNDNLKVQGNLTVLGLINGVDVSNLGSATGALRVFSGGGLTIKVSGGSYRLNGAAVNYAGGTAAVTANTTNYVFFGSGGLTVRTMPFPTDESFIPLAEVVTNAGAVNYILDRRQLMSDDREQLVETILHPEYPDSAYSADGTNNVGQLSVSTDTGSYKNSYLWTSTRSTLQDYDIVLRLTLPSQFTSWKANPLSFLYKSSSADSSVTKLDVSMLDTAGNPVTLTGTSTNLANTAWTSQTLDFSGTPTWTPGGTVILKFTLSAKNNQQMQLGDLTIKYDKLTGK